MIALQDIISVLLVWLGTAIVGTVAWSIALRHRRREGGN